MSVTINHSRPTKSAGFTLLEVMISLMIFSVGMLGLAALQAVGVQENVSAYNRTLAMHQAANMAERIRTNYTAAGSGSYNSVSTTLTSAPTSCIHQVGSALPTCTDAQIAAHDIHEWNKRNQDLLPAGRGTVGRAGNLFTVTVMWDEARTGVTGESCSGNPAVDLKCYQLSFEI